MQKYDRTFFIVLSYHNLSVEDVTELELDRPPWRLLAASGATQ